MSVIRIKNLVQTCSACPSQWEAETLNGQAVYIRYRYGYLTMGIGKTIGEAVRHNAVGMAAGDGLDGVIGETEMLRLLSLAVEDKP